MEFQKDLKIYYAQQINHYITENTSSKEPFSILVACTPITGDAIQSRSTNFA